MPQVQPLKINKNKNYVLTQMSNKTSFVKDLEPTVVNTDSSLMVTVKRCVCCVRVKRTRRNEGLMVGLDYKHTILYFKMLMLF